MQSNTKRNGFTLVELVMVMAIVAILAGIATPFLLKAIPNMRLRSTARDIYSAMMQAKVEAIRRGENVTLLFNSPGDSYIMFLDNGAGAGGANDQTPNGTEPVIIHLTALPNRVTYDPGLVVDATPYADGVSFGSNAIIFTSRGMPVNAGGGFGAGTVGLRAVDANGNTQRQRTITVSKAGRIRIQ
jgi:prepilin-type N-terminal cleavage/methylation domain-containing protein